jgi:hypothetical protein
MKCTQDRFPSQKFANWNSCRIVPAPSLCSTRTNFQSSGTNVQDSAVTSPFRGRTAEDIQNANGSLTLQLPRRGSWRPDGVAATTLTTEASESGSDAS